MSCEHAGTAATKENANRLLGRAGKTGAGFTLDIIRHTVETDIRPPPSAQESRETMLLHIANRMELKPGQVEILIRKYGDAAIIKICRMKDDNMRERVVAKAYAAALPACVPSLLQHGVLGCHVALEDFESTSYPGQ